MMKIAIDYLDFILIYADLDIPTVSLTIRVSQSNLLSLILFFL